MQRAWSRQTPHRTSCGSFAPSFAADNRTARDDQGIASLALVNRQVGAQEKVERGREVERSREVQRLPTGGVRARVHEHAY